MGKETVKMPKDPGKPTLKKSIKDLEKMTDELLVAINAAKNGDPDPLINYFRKKAGLPPLPPPPPDWLRKLKLDRLTEIANTMQANVKNLNSSFVNLNEAYEVTLGGFSK